MIKKRRNLFIMLVVIVLVLSATVGAIVTQCCWLSSLRKKLWMEEN